MPANGFSHERFRLAGAGSPVEGWLHEDTARELFAAGGFDLDKLRADAEKREFRPVDLKTSARIVMKSTVRKVDDVNVVGIVPGTDPKLKAQAVVYSAHWDHFGVDPNLVEAAESALAAEPGVTGVRSVRMRTARPGRRRVKARL